MILLVPVSRFSISFEVGAGRPYSRLEELVCRMIMSSVQPVTLKHLRAAFQVHDRLLIESVVTLVRAGWAAMNLGEGLVMTDQGRQAMHKGAKPQGTLIRKKRTTLYMERICGLLERDSNAQLNVYNLHRLKTAGLSHAQINDFVLPIRNRRNTLSIGQAQGLLPHWQGEWIRWIGEPTMQTKATEFVPVYVDLQTRAVSGLPRAWEPLLTDVILAQAETREADDGEPLADGWGRLEIRRDTESRALGALRRTGPVMLRRGAATVIRSTLEFEVATRDLANEATRSLLIATPLIGGSFVRQWEPTIRAAVIRGVQVDVLWGRTDPADDGLSELKRIAATTASGSARLLRYNIRGADIISQFVLADRGQSGQDSTALVGGAPLLGRDEASAQNPPAIALRSAAAAAQLARAAAGWWAQTPGEEFSAAVHRWRRLAAEWAQTTQLAYATSDADKAAVSDLSLDAAALHEALIMLDADCALLPEDEAAGPEPVGTVIVRGYSDSFLSRGGMAPKGAVAVQLTGAK